MKRNSVKYMFLRRDYKNEFKRKSKKYWNKVAADKRFTTP